MPLLWSSAFNVTLAVVIAAGVCPSQIPMAWVTTLLTSLLWAMIAMIVLAAVVPNGVVVVAAVDVAALSLSLSLIRLANRSRSRHVRFRVPPSLSSSLSLPASLHHSLLASLSPSADLCHLVTHRPASLCISLCHLVTLSPIRRPAHPPQPGLSSKKLACQISLKHHTCQTHSSHAAHTLTINVSPTPEKKSSLRALETLQSGRKKERETGWSEHAHTRTLRVPPPQKPPKKTWRIEAQPLNYSQSECPGAA